MTIAPPTLEQLARAQDAVGRLIAGIRDDQWSAPTPCTEWTVRDVVIHLVGINQYFTAILLDQAPPERGADPLGDDPVAAYREAAAALLAAFDQPGVMARSFEGPLGTATGADRLHIRIADLLAHGWDLAQATGQPADLPTDLVEQALAFGRVQFTTMPRTGRFAEPTTVPDDAPALDRLVAFLGRTVPSDR